MSKPDIFIITSVLKVCNTPLQTGFPRSVFDLPTRFEQTLFTLQSIREKNENVIIIFLESSDISKEYEDILKSKVEHYFNFSSNEKILNKINDPNKSKGERALLNESCKIIKKLIDEGLSPNRIFKISGRYYLDENYMSTDFSNNYFTIRIPFQNSYKKWVSTCLYSFPSSFLSNFQKILKIIKCSYKFGSMEDIETLLYNTLLNFCHKERFKIVYLSTLGVSGLIAINGEKCCH